MSFQVTCTIPADIQEVRHCTDRLEQSVLSNGLELSIFDASEYLDNEELIAEYLNTAKF